MTATQAGGRGRAHQGCTVTDALVDATAARVLRRLLPFLILLYFVNQIDRVNISFAALSMNKDLGLSPTMYGFGAGIFFISYFLFEIPSNLVMHRVGARLWMFRIMLTWGAVSAAMVLLNSATGFYILRFLLGLAEAGFVPGMFLYLSYWIPARHMGRANGLFILAAPLSTVLAGPLSVGLLELDGILGLHGWQWLFLAEGVPAIILAFVALRLLPDRPRAARWLSGGEADCLERQLAAESAEATGRGGHSLWYGVTSPVVLLLSLVYFTFVIGLYGIAFWLPQIVRGLGFANLQTGFIVAGPYFLGTLACLFWPMRSDRAHERRWHFALPAFVAAGGLVLSAIIGPQPVALIPISLAVVGIWAALPVFWCVPVRYLAGIAAASGMAMINAVGNLGGFAGPYLVGWLRESTGSFTMALVLLGVAPLVAGLLALLLKPQVSRDAAGATESSAGGPSLRPQLPVSASGQ